MMKQSMKATLLSIIAILFLFYNACKTSNSDDPLELDLVPIQNIVVDGYTVSLFSYETLEEGTNELFWTVEENNDPVQLQSFSITPRVGQGSIEHSCPYDDPILFEQNKSYYHCNIVFNQAGNDTNPWFIDFDFTTKSNEHVTGTLTLDVTPSWRVKSVSSYDGHVYYITWDKPRRPVVGINGLEVLVHKRSNQTLFPPVGNATLEINPYKNLGNGQRHTTNFGNPVRDRNGRYKGYINFDETGSWITSLKLKAEGDTLNAVFFRYDVFEE